MLQEISIKNFAIIEEVVLSFDKGMTILTGETGAGKSIIIDAMSLLLGGRASSDYVRHGAEKAEVEGLFFAADNPDLEKKLSEHGLEFSNDIILRREVYAGVRSVCRVNGQLVTLAVLRDIGRSLIDIHGQHDNQILMNSRLHLALLDEFGDEAFDELKASYEKAFIDYRKLRKQLSVLKENKSNFADRIDLLELQKQEIEELAINLEEDEQLPERQAVLAANQTIAASLQKSWLLLDDENEMTDSTLANVRTVMDELSGVADMDNHYKSLSEKAGEAYYILEDVVSSLDGYLSDLEFDPDEFAAIEERNFQLTAIKKKYGPELSDVLEHLEKINQELSKLMVIDEDESELREALKSAQTGLVMLAEDLSSSRHNLAESLETDIEKELDDLYMEEAAFKVQFTPAKFSLTGNEEVEFYIQTNPGEGLKPLAKTASGGEISRLMLAIKSSFARKENKTSIVFDEVDTGVSGRVAQAIAEKIYKIAGSGQVLAISHLPQVVAIADTQFYIEKSSTEDVTTSTVRKLTPPERVEEIAKMLAGDKVTPEALAQAKKLLEK